MCVFAGHYSTMSAVWGLLLIVLHTGIIDDCTAECRYPDYMQTLGEEPSWFINYQHGVTVELTVKGGAMYMKECRSLTDDCKLYDRECQRHYGDGRYLVKQVLRRRRIYGDDYSFVCLRFIPLSPRVVQMRISLNKGTIAASMCTDSMLMLDQYPLVSREHVDYTSDCPVTGGYDFQLYTSDTAAKPVCDELFLPLRLESDCVNKEGMKFYLRPGDCVGKQIGRELAEEIEVRCIAKWSYRGYVFSVVKWDQDRNYWCIRVLYRDDAIYELVIFLSGICPSDRKTQSNILILKDFKRHYIQGVCADEAPVCRYERKFCSTNAAERCKLSCSLCQPDQEERPCSFPNTFRGNWYGLHEPTENIVSIANNSLTDPKTGLQWFCVESVESRTSRKTIIKLKFSNGCYPRYTCLDIEIPALSVLRYRTGTELSWPIESLQTVCEDRYFSMKPINTQRSQSVIAASRPWFYFISEDPAYVTCNLPWYISKISPFVMYDSNNTEKRRGCLINNAADPSHILNLVYTHNRKKWNNHIFVCLASLKFIGENDQLVTHNVKLGVYVCWTFVKGPYGSVFVYLYNAKDCGNGTNMQLVNSHRAMATLVIRPNASDCDFIEDEQRETILRRRENAVSQLTNRGCACAYMCIQTCVLVISSLSLLLLL